MADVLQSNAVITVDVLTNGQVDFDFDFRCDGAEDLFAIYRTDAGMTLDLSGGSDFTVAGIGNPTGGTITLTSFTATEAGATLTIYRDVAIERTTDYQRDLFARDINAEMITIFMILQDLNRKASAALSVSPGEDPPDIQSIFDAADAAAASAAAAAQSAIDAALFDPSSYYTRTEIDALLAAQAARIQALEDLVSGDLFSVIPVGGLYFDDGTAGMPIPDKDSSKYRYIELTANLMGVGQYNEGVLTSQSLSGAGVTLNAAAVISKPGSPLHGSTQRLWNSEGRVLRPGVTAGTLAECQNLAHVHTGTADNAGGHTHNVPQAATSSGSSFTVIQAPSITTNTFTTVPTQTAGAHVHNLTIASEGGTEVRVREARVRVFKRIS